MNPQSEVARLADDEDKAAGGPSEKGTPAPVRDTCRSGENGMVLPGAVDKRPSVRLRPNARVQAIREGAPWIYADELVLDRRTRALAPGVFARLDDPERQPLGLVTVNPGSKIVARVMDPDPSAEIDRRWIANRLSRALSLRRRLYETPFYRLVHAEADGLPGVVIDRYGSVVVIQPNAAWSERLFSTLVAALQDVLAVDTVIKNGASRARRLEGLPEGIESAVGKLDRPVAVPLHGVTYFADLLAGQKTGFYFDQRENQAFVARLAAGARVLDVFTHVGGFALAALKAGAVFALGVDASAAALRLAEEGARASGLAARFQIRRGDAFAVLAELAAAQERFDIVICDPPAFAPSKAALVSGLRAYERLARLAASLVCPGGYLVLCSCSHAADLFSFRAACTRGILRAKRNAQLVHTGFAGPDHPELSQLPETSYLKALVFRL